MGDAAGQLLDPAGSASSLPILVAQQLNKEYGDRDHGVAANDVVLDCGAHVEIYTRQALAEGARLVVAIEPAPDNLECLRRNLRDEIDAGRVLVYPKGVWDKEELLPLYVNPENSAADSFVLHGQGMIARGHLPPTTIDRLVEELELDRVDLIKMDIKGATVKALRGAARTLQRDRPGLIISTEEEHDDAPGITAYVEQFGLGYRAECGSCSVSGELIVMPQVVFYR